MEPHKKQLHVTLAYHFQASHLPTLEKLAQNIDVKLGCDWVATIFSRDIRFANHEVCLRQTLLGARVQTKPGACCSLCGGTGAPGRQSGRTRPGCGPGFCPAHEEALSLHPSSLGAQQPIRVTPPLFCLPSQPYWDDREMKWKNR